MIPPILLEGDEDEPRLTLGPGRRFAVPLAGRAASSPKPVELGLPVDYGTGKLWLSARDPHTLHATWDLNADQLALAAKAPGGLWLRVCRSDPPESGWLQVLTEPGSRSAFVRVELADAAYAGELGIQDPAGDWLSLAVSAPVRTPPDGPAETGPVRFVSLAPVEPTPPAAPLELQFAPAPVPPPAPVAPAVEIEPQASTEIPRVVIPLPTPPALPAPPPVSAQHEQEPAKTTQMLERATRPAPALTPAAPRAAYALVEAPTPAWSGDLESAWRALWEEFFRTMPPSSIEFAVPPPPKPEMGGAIEGLPPAGLGAPAAEALFSEAAVPAPGPKPRGFWFNVNAEIVVYGATEPDARVTIDGRTVALRPDGTFTLRFALPDGAYGLRAEAASADGAERRRARFRFGRQTTYQGAVGRHETGSGLEPPATAPVQG